MQKKLEIWLNIFRKSLEEPYRLKLQIVTYSLEFVWTAKPSLLEVDNKLPVAFAIRRHDH